MDCKGVGPLVDRYIDNELPPDAKEALEAHISHCANCEPLIQRERAWQREIHRNIIRFTAPEGLRRRIGVALAATERPAAVPPRAWALGRGWAIAASLLLAVALSSGVTTYLVAPQADDRFTQEILASHVRSLMADHLTDVASSDRHTVKPWFNGKLDYTPPVDDLASEGFPLIGGRLDYIEQRPVAALVYRHAQHPINLFVWPSRENTAPPASLSQNGYNILHWAENNFDFWAVSDLNAAELQDFEKLIRQHG